MDPTLWQIAQPILAGQLRHVLTVGAGMLIAKGAIQADQQGAFIEIGLGLATWAVGAGWSWWQKSGQALVAAQLARLRRHVDAIPQVPSNMPKAAEVNAAVETAKIAAEPPPKAA